MAIDSNEFEIEKIHLDEVEKWIFKEKKVVNENREELEDRIAELKKQARGRYNEELETSQKLYEITQKSLNKYNECVNQPYFARIDFREYRREEESYYIGKFGLSDSKTGDEKVIDWRAPISDLYYSGTEGEAYYEAPIGIINGELHLKRKFLIKSGKLKDAFDEGINQIILKGSSDAANDNELIDEYLKINLEESISGKLKDVVATIQKEQNNIIRANKNEALIVQGSAGSGKTTIALHRLAYLLYKYRNSLTGNDIIVVAPNKLFLDYISEVLPNLGVEKVKQKTFEEIASQVIGVKQKVYTKDKKLSDIIESKDASDVHIKMSISKLKGSIGFKTLMDRYIRNIEINDINIDDIKVDNYILFEKKEIKRLYAKDMVRFPLNKRKDEIKRYFNLKLSDKISDVLDKIDFTYEYMIARIKKTMEDGPDRRKKLIEVYDERDSKKKDIQKRAVECFDEFFEKWKRGNVVEIYYNLFSDENIFNEVTDGKVPSSLVDAMREEIKRNSDNGIVDSDDLNCMLYLKLRIDDIPEKSKFKHMVIDEAQDYSAFQLYTLKLMTYNNSCTIVGDIGQGIYYYRGISDWNDVLKNVYDGEGKYITLTQSYRSTIEIINFANRVLSHQNINLVPAKPVLRHGKEPLVEKYSTGKEFAEKVDKITENLIESGRSSVAIIGKNYDECKKIKEILKKGSKYSWNIIKETDKSIILDKIVIPSYMTKGLEFDCSVIYNCNSEEYKDNELDKKLLYVSLTRALHEEYIFYNGELSPIL